MTHTVLSQQNDTATRRVVAGDPGHHVYGPYESRPAGVYRVEYDLALEDVAEGADRVCAVLDVCCDDGTVVLADRRVFLSDLAQDKRAFSVLVELSDIRNRLEYRIYATGEATLHVGIAPRLTRVSGVLDLFPRDELARMDPAALADDTRRILRHLEPHRLLGYGFVRLGNPGDGGYVCVDDWDGIDTAFSFGINDDISWDRDAADRGLRIYQFDHTVADPAPQDDRMVFEPRMIAAEPGEGRQDLAGLISRHDKRRVRPNIILKTDIEGGEWPMIEATSAADLSRIAWIVCELHYFQGLAEPAYRAKLDRGLEKLGESFALVHIHANVWGGCSAIANVTFPNVIEATFVNRAIYEVADGRELFPTELDRTCDARMPDYYLGAFRF